MREFIEKMRKAGLVTDVKDKIAADMEAPKMAAGTDRLLFFHNLDGHRAVMNLTASRRSLGLARAAVSLVSLTFMDPSACTSTPMSDRR